ncbi:MAG: SBBP repeat-containing protein, partial [Bryobacterales bacterium]|nr:SBBP repeat-containing protein [Bryobacterales bacterium]
MRVPALYLLLAASALGQNVPQPVLDRLTRSSIRGLGTDRVTAALSDSAGYFYLAGTTTSPDLGTPLAEGQLVTSTDAAATFARLPEPPAVSLTAVGAARNVILVGGATGIYKTVDTGKTWRLTYRFPPEVTSLRQIAFDPGDPSRVYAPWLSSTRSGLLVSTDAGDTWRVVPDGPSGSTLRFDPNRAGTFLVLGDGAFLSTDGGVSFTRIVFDGSPPSSIAFDAHHPGWLTAIAFGALYRSTDYGRAWTRVGPVPPGALDILGEPSRAARYYLTSILGGAFRSDDDGRTWTALPGSPEGRLTHYCGPGGPVAITGTNSQVSVSHDQGGTWRSLSISNLNDLTFNSECVAFAVRGISGDAWVARFSPDARERLWFTPLGGSGQDTVEKLALDPAGNVVVAGRTDSSDFPGPAFGASPPRSFVAKFDPAGRLLWSSRFGVPDLLSVAALTAGSASLRLYLTTGTSLSSSTYVTGTSLAEFDAQGSLVEASLFPGNVASAAVSASGETVLAIYAFAGSYLLRSDGTRIPLDVAPTHAVFHPSGDLVVAGYGSIARGCTSRGSVTSILSGGSFEIRKFRAATFEPALSVSLSGECQTLPTSLTFDPAGNFVVTARTIASNFPLRNPLFGGPSHLTSLVVKLSPKGELLQSTYVPSLGGAAANEMGLALALNEGGIVLGLLEPEPPPPVELNRISNAFSGLGRYIVAGSLVTLSGRNLGPVDYIDLGLNPSNPLPTELGGTRVLVNGQPAP